MIPRLAKPNHGDTGLVNSEFVRKCGLKLSMLKTANDFQNFFARQFGSSNLFPSRSKMRIAPSPMILTSWKYWLAAASGLYHILIVVSGSAT